MENQEKMEKKIEVQKPTVEDVRGIQEVFYKTWLATYPNEEAGITREDIEEKFKDTFSEEVLARRAEKIKNPPAGHSFFVAKDGQTVVGLCNVINDETRNKLSTLYVLPEYQGKGIGSSLWKQARSSFDPKRDITVEVATYNANAIAFYKKLGFEDTGKRFDDALVMKSGAVIPEMEMAIKGGYKG